MQIHKMPIMEVVVNNDLMTAKKYAILTEYVYIIADKMHDDIFEKYKLDLEKSETGGKQLYNLFATKFILIVLRYDKTVYCANKIGSYVLINGKHKTDTYIELNHNVDLKLSINGCVLNDIMLSPIVLNALESNFLYVQYKPHVKGNKDSYNIYTDLRNLVMGMLTNYAVEPVTLDFTYAMIKFDSEFGVIHFLRQLIKKLDIWSKFNVKVELSAGAEYGNYDKYTEEACDYIASYNGIALNKVARLAKLGKGIVFGRNFYNRICGFENTYKIELLTKEEHEMKGFKKQEVFICKFK